MTGGRPVGGMVRGICGPCGLDVGVRVGGTAIAHGPYENRCPGSGAAPEVILPQWDGPGPRVVTVWTRPRTPLEAIRAEEARGRIPRGQQLHTQPSEEN